MFRFLKINPQTLYAHLSQEELRALGIDVKENSMATKNRVMELVLASLGKQQELVMNEPLSIHVSVTPLGMQILVTSVSGVEEVYRPPNGWEQAMGELNGMHDIIQFIQEETFETIYVFRFLDVEDVLQLVRVFSQETADIILSHFYFYQQHYYLVFDFFRTERLDTIQDQLSVVAEYGTLAHIAPVVLEEHGQLLVEDGAIEELYDQFFGTPKKSN